MPGEIIHFLNKAYEFRPYTMWERLITQPIILSRYIFLLLVPVADYLTLDSNIFASRGLLSPPITIVANFFIFSVITLSIYFSRRYPLVCFAIIFYFINHLVESTIIGLELYFEHRNYLPSIFIYLIISYFFSKNIYFYNEKGKKFMYSLFVIFVTFIVICEGNATYLRNDVWKDEISLNLDNIQKAPLNVRGYNNLAAEYIAQGNNDKAIEYLKLGEQIYKKHPENYQQTGIADIYYNAGLVYLHGKENTEKATQLLLKSVDLNPLGFMMHYQLAIAFFQLGDFDNAETAIFNAAQLQDDQSQIYNLFGRILYAKGKYDLAVKVLIKGLQVEKRREIYLNLAASYLAMSNDKQARSVLLKMDVKENDLLYLLYRLIVASNLEKEKLIVRIIDLIQEQQIDYCKWIDELNENNHVGIIYPDISNFKETLTQAYIAGMNNRAMIIHSKINMVNDCCM